MSSRLLASCILAVLCTSAETWSQGLQVPAGSVYWALHLSGITVGVTNDEQLQSLPVQPCQSDALDTTIQGSDGPDHSYTLAINLRNISAETCFVGTHPGGPGVSPRQAPDGSWVKICYYCEGGAQKPPEGRITLAPGESAHQTGSWKTTPTDGATQCVSPTEMTWDRNYEGNSYVGIFSHSLLKLICSPLVITNYAAGQFLSDTVANLAPGPRVPLIKWANDEAVSYSRERIPLRVTVGDPGHVLSLDEHSCPRIFVRVRDATPWRYSRVTRVDEVQGVACKVNSAGASGRRFIMDFDASYAIKQEDGKNKGEYTVDVSSLAELKGRYLLVGTTSSLHLSMVGGKFIKRNWSSPVEGVAVSLTLDKDVYDVGSEIPLHIALENFDSHTTIASPDPGGDPPGVAVQLQDSYGQPIAPRGGAIWSGHGSCRHFIPGLVVPVELTLSQMGFRPDRPGIYKVVVTWSTSKDANCGPGLRLGSPADYFTVRSSPVTFRLVTGTIAKPDARAITQDKSPSHN